MRAHEALHAAIAASGFTLLGAFSPQPGDGLADTVRTVLLLGNAGPGMFRRFLVERSGCSETLDDWTRRRIDALARGLDVRAVYPFDRPYPPIQAWARRAGAGFASPLGLNIHPQYGLWHAFRAALLFDRGVPVDAQEPASHPCESCSERPCLRACPVSAFDGASYDTGRCADWISDEAGQDCMQSGCGARRACPVGRAYLYEPVQAHFHMRAFRDALGKGN